MSDLACVVYVSSAARAMSDQELDAILVESRANNETAGITGMLLYADGNFAQALEGPAEALDRLLVRLAADPRHQGIITVARLPIEARRFAGWSMGFRRVRATPEEIADSFRGLRDPLTGEGTADSFAHRLLELFRSTNPS